MKKIFVLLFIITPFFVFSQTKNKEWNYAEYWEKLQSINHSVSYGQKLKDCQVPQELLEEMTTEALVKTCLRFPFLLDIYAFENIQDGFARITSDFNGLNELYSRNDAATTILRLYKKINATHIREPHTLDKKYKDKPGKFVIELDYIEVLLAQNEILSKLTPSERKQLAKECIQKHDEKCKNNDLYGIANIHSTVLILGRLLDLENEYHNRDTKLKTLEHVKKGQLKKIESFIEILDNAKNYVSQ